MRAYAGIGRAGRRRRVLAAAVLILTATTAGRGWAGTVNNTNPFWLNEEFTDINGLDPAQTTACVDTVGPGTLTLCGRIRAAVDPTRSRYILAGATETKLYAYNGSQMEDRTAEQGPGAGGAVDTDWDAAGILTLATDRGFTDYAPDASGRLVPVPGGAVGGRTGIRGLAARSGARWLLEDGGNIRAWAWTGSGYTRQPSWDLMIAGATDLIISRDGRWLAARLDTGEMRIFTWFGGGWMERKEMAPSVTGVLDTCFFPDSSGYWLLVPGGTIRAFGFTGTGVREIPYLSITVAGAERVVPGFQGRDALALTRGDARYMGISEASGREASGYGVRDHGLGRYPSPAPAQSLPFTLDHNVDMVNVRVLQALPSGTGSTFAVSTDGGATWRPAPLAEWSSDGGSSWAPAGTAPPGVFLWWRSGPVAVPPGARLLWRSLLHTAAPTAAPQVDRLEIYELRQRLRPAGRGEVRMRLVE